MTKQNFLRYIRYAVGLALIPMFIYLGSIAVGLVQGVSLTEDVPEYTMRLQILDMTRKTVDMKEINRLVSLCEDESLMINIVDVDSMTIRSIDSTFVVGRVQDLAGPKLLAARLGLNNEDVIYRPLDNNRDQVTATLVLGADLEGISKKLTGKKEK